jgi:DNA-binding NarL/FixJ family response regulator
MARSRTPARTPTEGVEHAAREELRRAVAELERTRGDGDTVPTIAEWTGLVAARWTVVEHFESDGQRYLLARRNDPAVHGLSVLTERERQVASFAVLGHSSKLIAYELGLADSTVRVLLHRACRKLGVQAPARLADVWPELRNEPERE